MQATIVELTDAGIGFAGQSLFEPLNLSIPQGQWVALLGPNGCGKTTFLRSILGLIPLRQGVREVHAERIGYVPQRFFAASDSLLTVHEFLQLHPLYEITYPELHRRRNLILFGLDLRSLLSRPLRVLSAGQIQKVLLAFALWGDPELILLDEFMESIDPNAKDLMLSVLQSFRRETHMTVIEVSHDVMSVSHLADRVLLLRGKIVFDGSPEAQGFHQGLHEVYGPRPWIKGVA